MAPEVLALLRVINDDSRRRMSAVKEAT